MKEKVESIHQIIRRLVERKKKIAQPTKGHTKGNKMKDKPLDVLQGTEDGRKKRNITEIPLIFCVTNSHPNFPFNKYYA